MRNQNGSFPDTVEMFPIAVGIGANLGNPLLTCRRTIDRLANHGRCQALHRSFFYRTAPVGPAHQPRFINAVVLIEGTWTPWTLLRLLRRLEREAGRDRQREIRWGPRPLDLDLLFFGQRIIRRNGLIVPHPRLHQRRFVLRPLADVAANWRHPILGKTVDTLLREVDDVGSVERMPDGALTFRSGKR